TRRSSDLPTRRRAARRRRPAPGAGGRRAPARPPRRAPCGPPPPFRWCRGPAPRWPARRSSAARPPGRPGRPGGTGRGMLPVRDPCRPSWPVRAPGSSAIRRAPGPGRAPFGAYPRAMEALAKRLSHLDPEAGGALRVIMFYDTLMRRRADLPALARASAGLAECAVGIRLHGTGQTIRFAPDGRPAPDPAPPASAAQPVTLDEEEIGTVWLERTGPPNPLDELVLDRIALATAAIVERYGPARTTMADPALVELAISPGGDESARARAVGLLGFPAGLPVRAAAVRSDLPLDRVGARICPGRPVKAAPLGEVGVILAGSVDRDPFPAGVHAGI